MNSYRIERASDPQDLARSAAEHIGAAIDLALDQRDRAQIAFGGSTALAYERLGEEHLPWDRVDVLLGDERWVAADDESSNARMLRNTLLSLVTQDRAPAFIPFQPLSYPQLRPVLRRLHRCSPRSVKEHHRCSI